MFCCTLLYVHFSIAIILMGKRELIALLNLSSWCLVMVERLFLTVPRGCLQFVIVVFPDHTHLLFLVKFSVLQQTRIVYSNSIQRTLLSILSNGLGNNRDHARGRLGRRCLPFLPHFALSMRNREVDFAFKF